MNFCNRLRFIIRLINVLDRNLVPWIDFWIVNLWFLAIWVCDADLCFVSIRLCVSGLVGARYHFYRVIIEVGVRLDQARVLSVVSREKPFSVRSSNFIWVMAVFFTALVVGVDFAVGLLRLLVAILVKMGALMILRWQSMSPGPLWFCHDFGLLILRFRVIVVGRIALLVPVVEWVNIVIGLALISIAAIVLVSWAFTATRIVHWVQTFVFCYNKNN